MCQGTFFRRATFSRSSRTGSGFQDDTSSRSARRILALPLPSGSCTVRFAGSRGAVNVGSGSAPLCEVRFGGKCSSLWSGCHCAVTPKSLRPMWPWSSESAVSGWRRRSGQQSPQENGTPWTVEVRRARASQASQEVDGRGFQGLDQRGGGPGLHVSSKGCRWSGLPVWLTTLFRFATWLLMRMLLWSAEGQALSRNHIRPSRSFVILKGTPSKKTRCTCRSSGNTWFWCQFSLRLMPLSVWPCCRR